MSASPYIKIGLLSIQTALKLTPTEIDALNQMNLQQEHSDKATLREMLIAMGITVETQQRKEEKSVLADRLLQKKIEPHEVNHYLQASLAEICVGFLEYNPSAEWVLLSLNGMLSVTELTIIISQLENMESQGNISQREQTLLMMLYYKTNLNLDKVYEYMLKATVIAPDAIAEYICGMIEQKEFKNNEVAFKRFKEAACHGFIEAQAKLAECYAYGSGVVANSQEAMRWMQKAARRGLPYAQFSLAQRYEEGAHVPRDDEKAFEWYWKASRYDIPGLQFSIGQYYAKNRYHSLAAKCFRKAAIQGLERAENELLKLANDAFRLETTYHCFMTFLLLDKLDKLDQIDDKDFVKNRFYSLAYGAPEEIKELLLKESLTTINKLRHMHVIDHILKALDSDESFVMDTLQRKMEMVSKNNGRMIEAPKAVAHQILKFLGDPSIHKNTKLAADTKKICEIKMKKEIYRKRIKRYEEWIKCISWNINTSGLAGWLGKRGYEIQLSHQKKVVPYSIYLQWSSAEQAMKKNDTVGAWNQIVRIANLPLHPYDHGNTQVSEFFEKFTNENMIKENFDPKEITVSCKDQKFHR